MFGIDWSDPQTLWLNLTNLALGLVTLAAMLVLAAAVVRELALRRQKARELSGLDAEVAHLMRVPGLGWTMADGGEPVKPPAPTEPGKDSTRK